MNVDAALGGLIFSVVELPPQHEGPWRRWYARDHFYAGAMAGPGVVAGACWRSVARWTPAGIDHAPEWYLGTYLLLAGMLEDYGTWSAGVLPRLAAEGRMFTERRHVHRGRYAFTEQCRGIPAIPPITALDHDFPTLVAVLLPAAGAPDPGPAGTGDRSLQLEFAALPGGASLVAPPQSRLVLAFSRSADAGATALGAVLAEVGRTDALWAASFRRLRVVDL